MAGGHGSSGTESNSRGLTSVIRGDRIVNRIRLAGPKDGRPFRLRVRTFDWVREAFAFHQSSGASGTVNWFEAMLTALARFLMVGAVLGLLYFCIRMFMFVHAYSSIRLALPDIAQ
jgi:hypothetical protein